MLLFQGNGKRQWKGFLKLYFELLELVTIILLLAEKDQRVKQNLGEIVLIINTMIIGL